VTPGPRLLRGSLKRAPAAGETDFPFSIPAIRTLPPLDVSAPVTFFVGENGSGKSTLLEGLAAAASLPTVGAAEVGRDGTLAAQRLLAARLQLTWAKRTHRGFFLRAEDFFGFQRRLAAERREFEERLAEIDVAYGDRSAYAKGLAAGPVRASLGDMERRYGRDPDARSHGQAFLNLFQGRFVPDGLSCWTSPRPRCRPRTSWGCSRCCSSGRVARNSSLRRTHPCCSPFPAPPSTVSIACRSRRFHTKTSSTSRSPVPFSTTPLRFCAGCGSSAVPTGRH